MSSRPSALPLEEMGKHKTNLDESTLAFATIGQLGDALRKREISCVELTKYFAERLEKQGPEYNALALSLRKDARKAAKDVDWYIKRDRFRGPLQGIPFAVKDLLSVADFPTTWGAKPFADQVFDFDATAARKLKNAKGILLGKLAMVELAGGGGYTSASASLQGPARNPWNKQYWAGGSSSGSGAAVGAGLVPYALGSETSGSILTPACYCGVSGLRPTYGLVSRHGAMALSWTLDKIGPFARTAEDCGIILQAIAGGDSKDPGSAGKSFYYTPQYARPMKELKVGYAPIDFTDRADAAARPAFAAALAALKQTGVPLIETELPAVSYGPILSTILNSE